MSHSATQQISSSWCQGVIFAARHRSHPSTFVNGGSDVVMVPEDSELHPRPSTDMPGFTAVVTGESGDTLSERHSVMTFTTIEE